MVGQQLPPTLAQLTPCQFHWGKAIQGILKYCFVSKIVTAIVDSEVVWFGLLVQVKTGWCSKPKLA